MLDLRSIMVMLLCKHKEFAIDKSMKGTPMVKKLVRKISKTPLMPSKKFSN